MEAEPLLAKKGKGVVVVEARVVVPWGKEEEEEKRKKSRVGLYLQYLAVGIVYGGLPATLYGLFLGYLNVEGYVYSTAATIVSLPWSFKFCFGAINDCWPLFGYRRKSYMVLGWTLCFAALARLAIIKMPEPYWCVNASGDGYVKTRVDSSGATVAADPCNANAASSGGRFALWLMVASLGYCVSDVAADGLTVTIARSEPASERGTTQTTVYFVRTLGNILAVAIVGLCSSWKYEGTFSSWGIGFPTICGILALPAAIMIPCSWFLVDDRRVLEEEEEDDDDAKVVFPAGSPRRQYARRVWELLRSKAMLYVILFEMGYPLIGGIATTASGEVKSNWANVKTFQNSLFSVFGLGLFASGLWLVKSRFLHSSWRLMTLVTTVFLNLIDMPFSFLTIFDVVRNQYFYLGETVLLEIPSAANFVVATFVIVEMAEGGNEGIVYGLLTTTANLGSPFANAISNQLFRLFRPSLSNPANYIDDTPKFRRTVACSFALSYLASFASLVTLPLLPDQKDEALARKRKWPRRDAYAYITIALVAFGLVYSVTVNILAMFPATVCLRLAGGDGCS